MNDLFSISLFAGTVLSLVAFLIGISIKKWLRLAIFNPILICICIVIAVLQFFKIDYDSYQESTQILSWFLTPATVCLAIPLYEQRRILLKYWKAIFCGLLTGVLTSLTTVFVLSRMLGLDHAVYATMLPKSVTTPIGMAISEELGGIVTITVAVIVITGIVGNVFGDIICKVFRIQEPISVGLSFGASSHVIGTAHAIEIGELEGAMSGLAIAVSGILTVLIAPFFSNLI